MLNLEIDIETFSSVNLAKAGVYRYAESPDFEVLLFGYSVDGGEVKVGDLVKGEKIPEEVMSALEDEAVTKSAKIYTPLFAIVYASFFKYIKLPDEVIKSTLLQIF